MQDKEEERSLVNVENMLTKDGFTQDFKVTDGRLHTLDPASPRLSLPQNTPSPCRTKKKNGHLSTLRTN